MMPPSLPVEERFPVILGTDILYEMPHAAMVAAALSHRLEAGGKAMLGCAVRQHVSVMTTPVVSAAFRCVPQTSHGVGWFCSGRVRIANV